MMVLQIFHTHTLRERERESLAQYGILYRVNAQLKNFSTWSIHST